MKFAGQVDSGIGKERKEGGEGRGIIKVWSVGSGLGYFPFGYH
jgi:hypothetical protein